VVSGNLVKRHLKGRDVAQSASLGRAERKARLGKAGLGKGGNLGMGSIYLFFLAFFFAGIGLFSFSRED